MKFEKFLKAVGTHGEVIEINESERWLVCGGVGMVIPLGVDNILGVPNKNDDVAHIVHVLTNLELDDPLTLHEAVLFDPAGGTKDIYRVFETAIGDYVGIINANYGLLEKKDVLGYAEIETAEKQTVKFVLVYDASGNIQGFIEGSDKF